MILHYKRQDVNEIAFEIKMDNGQYINESWDKTQYHALQKI